MDILDLLLMAYTSILAMTLADWIGWIGTALIVLAFGFNTAGFVASTSVPYLAMNIVGSTLFGFSCFDKALWSGVSLQSVWVGIALMAVIRNGRAAG